MDTDPADSSSDQQTAHSDDSVSDRLIAGLSSHAVFMLDTDGTITTWPEPAASLYGHDRDATVGRHVDMVFADPEEMETTVESLLTEAADGPVETQHWHRRADGSVFWATLSLSPLEDRDPEWFVAVSQDTTEKHQYDKMLERQSDRLKEFTDILAHDLKIPLSVISSRVHLAGKTGDEEHLDALEETSDRMARLTHRLRMSVPARAYSS